MKSTRRLLELTFVAMAMLSGLLLTISLGKPDYLVVGGLGTLLAFFIVDWMKWFSIPIFVANILSFVVLCVSMRGFFGTETSGQLGSVANLLVYLQTLLVLQEKSSRQFWQLLVLSFLQVVVASVFHMQLEGGVLFLAYMAISAVFLGMLSSLHQVQYADFLTKLSIPGRDWLSLRRKQRGQKKAVPVIGFQDPAELSGGIGRMVRHLSSWLFACLAFSAVLFVLIPRSDTPWYTGRRVDLQEAGATRRMSLANLDRVELSSAPVMRLTFRDRSRGEPIRLEEPAYISSMVLGSLTVRDGQTAWGAPYDWIADFHWRDRVHYNPMGRTIHVSAILEPTNDPLLHTIEPSFDEFRSHLQAEYCYELAASRRLVMEDQADMLPYEYAFRTAVDERGRFLDSRPYENGFGFSGMGIDGNRVERAWLTQVDRERYRGIIAIASRIADANRGKSKRELARAIEAWFLSGNGFEYTLDYTGVTRDESLDCIEDFVVNHRKGHCEFYASALAIMLRSQGIPTRYVVGFYGGTFMEGANIYQVNGTHGHAWVEAYIAPEDCTPEMMATGGASIDGAWLRLDATPPGALLNQFNNGSNTINLARNLWQDYVMSMENNVQASWGESTSSMLEGLLDLSNWSNGINGLARDIGKRPSIYLSILGPVGMMVLYYLLYYRRGTDTDPLEPGRKKVSAIRRFLGKTLDRIAPGLGSWIAGLETDSVWFNEKMNRILAGSGISRRATQTYTEFACEVPVILKEKPSASRVGEIVKSLVDQFQSVRFGGKTIDETEKEKIEAGLTELSQLLKQK